MICSKLVVGSTTSGLCTESVPIFELFGQADPGTEVGVSAANWAAVHTPRPAPRDGLIEKPSGRETTAFWTCGPARPSGSVNPSWLTERLKSYPVAVEARLEAGAEKEVVWKWRRSQRFREAGSPSASRLIVLSPTQWPGSCQESALTL